MLLWHVDHRALRSLKTNYWASCHSWCCSSFWPRSSSLDNGTCRKKRAFVTVLTFDFIQTPSLIATGRSIPIWKASLHFCQECNNLLYPKADTQRRMMVYGCRICQYDEIVDNKCVYRNDLLTVTKCVAHCFLWRITWLTRLRVSAENKSASPQI